MAEDNADIFGTVGGAGLGALLALPTGGISVPVGALLGATGGSLFGSLFKKKPRAPDVSAELARIQALFAEMREQAQKNINREAAQGRRSAASNLAARGVYSSGVSEHTFNQLESDRLNSIATTNAQLGAKEAELRSNVLGELLKLRGGYDAMNMQAGAARSGTLTALPASFLMALLQGGYFKGAPAPPPAPVDRATLGPTPAGMSWRDFAPPSNYATPQAPFVWGS